MLPATMPFLMSALTLGTIAFIVFFVSIVILTIPVFATRGRAQLAWLGGVGLVLTVEAAVLITAVVLQSDTGGGPAASTSKDGGATGGDTTAGAITVTLRDNLFVPKALTVKAGTEVTITVKNEGTAVHNMHILSKDQEGKDFISEQLVKPGQESTFTAQFSKSGTINFQCDFHAPEMVGTITVSP